MPALSRAFLVAGACGWCVLAALSLPAWSADATADGAAVIDPEKGMIEGLPFGATEAAVKERWAEPTGQIHFDAHRDAFLYGRSRLLLFFDGKLDGLRINDPVIDWKLSQWIQQKPSPSGADWRLADGITSQMTRDQVLRIIKPEPSGDNYNVAYSTDQALVQISFSHRVDLGETDAAYSVMGLLMARRQDGKDHWSEPPGSFPMAFGGVKSRKMLGLMLGESPDGIRITGVFKGSPADKAGIKKGDLITAVDGAPVVGKKPLDFTLQIAAKDAHELDVTSGDGSKRKVQVQLADGATFGRGMDRMFDPTEIVVGQLAPDFEAATSPDATKIKLSSLRGHPVLVIFTATWCQPCKIEAPRITALHAQYKDKGVQFVSVYLDGPTPDVYAFARGLGVDWPINTDGKAWENAAARAYGIVGVPTHVLIDKNGKVLQTNVHVPDIAAALDNALE